MFLLYSLFACTQSIPDGVPKKKLSVLEAPEYNRIKARHILVSYQNAWKADTPRNKQEALTRAEQLRDWAIEDYDFGRLAVKYSNDSSRIKRGYLGVVGRGEMLPEFEEALFALDFNEISDVVETGFGYHIIQRLPLYEAELTHILVQWEGTSRATTTRSKQDAEEIVTLVKKELQTSHPANVAERYSDGPMGSRGGYLGWIEKKELDPDFADAIFDLSPNQCSSAIEGQHGFHFFCVHARSP